MGGRTTRTSSRVSGTHQRKDGCPDRAAVLFPVTSPQPRNPSPLFQRHKDLPSVLNLPSAGVRVCRTVASMTFWRLCTAGTLLGTCSRGQEGLLSGMALIQGGSLSTADFQLILWEDRGSRCQSRGLRRAAALRVRRQPTMAPARSVAEPMRSGAASTSRQVRGTVRRGCFWGATAFPAPRSCQVQSATQEAVPSIQLAWLPS